MHEQIFSVSPLGEKFVIPAESDYSPEFERLSKLVDEFSLRSSPPVWPVNVIVGFKRSGKSRPNNPLIVHP